MRNDGAASSAWPRTSSSAPRLLDGRAEAVGSQILSSFTLKQLAGAMPSRFALADWRLLYSTTVHGISLNTLHVRTAGCGSCILAIKDREGNVFGAFCSEWREPSLPPSFYGSGECFLFSVERLVDLPPLPVGDAPPPNEAVNVHRWTGANSFFMLSDRDHLALGSGGHFGLWLDADLLHGSSGPSATFGNTCLCRQRCDENGDDAPLVGEFCCDVLEMWGMEHTAIARRQHDLMMKGLRP